MGNKVCGIICLTILVLALWWTVLVPITCAIAIFAIADD